MDSVKEALRFYSKSDAVGNIQLFYYTSEDKQWRRMEADSDQSEQASLPEAVFSAESGEMSKEVAEQIRKAFALDMVTKVAVRNDKKYLLGLRFASHVPVEVAYEMQRVVQQHIESLIGNQQLRESLDHYQQRIQKMLSEMGALHELSRNIESSHNIDHLLKYILQRSMNLLQAEAASLMLKVEERDELEFKVVLGPTADKIKPFRVKLGQGISGWVAQQGEPILIPDAYADARFDPSFDKHTGFRTKSYLCVPMVYKSRIFGVMTLLNRLDNQPFSENDKELLTIFASQAALAIENTTLLQTALEKERIDKELQVAAEIQQLLIPKTLPQIPDLQISATYIPCKEVSGDFYDIMALNDHQYVFIVADVSGKGVPGALLVSNMSASLKAYLEYSTDLKAIIERLNQKIMRNTTDDRYITFFFALYDCNEQSLHYINAGHNPPLLFQNNSTFKRLDTGGIFIGSLPWNYEQDAVQLASPSVLVLYTDGLLEAMNSREEEFGEARIKATIRAYASHSAIEIQEKIVQAVYEHVGGENRFEDDFTLIVIKK